LLMIGLDAMDGELVNRWVNMGKLPTFARLRETGFSTTLSSTAAQLPDTVWSSIYTGTNPAKFEKYFYVQYDRKTGDLKNVPDDEINGTPFWDYMADAGLTGAVIDAPKFPLSKRLKGVQLSNWGAHATKTARTSNPPSLLAEIDRRFGKHPVGDCDATDAKPAALAGLKQRVLQGVASHGKVHRWLMREQPWDVFFASFSAPHCIGHHFWHYMDREHPQHPKHDPEKLSDAIESVYAALDREIGEMIECAGPDVTVMVFAGHGMAAIYHASWNLPEILDNLGFGPAGNVRGPEAQKREAQVNPWRVLKMVLPGRLQYAIKASLPKRFQDELLFRWYAGARDWAGRPAFAVPNNDSVGAIRINVTGRDRHGLVAPGSEYRQVCETIATALNELVDPASGRKVVRRVTLLADEFHGRCIDDLPDLTVLWDQSFPWSAIHSERLGTLQIRRQDARSGSHTPTGFLFAAGTGVPAQRSGAVHSIYDIAPTALTLMKVPVPPIMDGKSLTGVWKAAETAVSS
jgi:predicted AlkP superfamily phosphohydrolase/phosphomutase